MPDASADELKAGQLRHWNSVAAGWGTWIDWVLTNFRPLTEWFAEHADWKAGARIADVASGAGYPALAAARLVQPDGVVVAIDLSPAMIAAAERGARALALDNIEFHTGDAEALDIGDASVDAVTNAYGLMFCANPLNAVRESCRVLRAGGRAAFATWADPVKSPFFNVVTPVARKALGLAEPAPGAPGPFRLSSQRDVIGLLRAAGFKDVTVESLSMPFECETIDEYLQMFSDLAWSHRMSSLTASQRAALRDDVARAAEPYQTGARLRLMATSICAAGRKE